ncbi:MAG: hypothetical protein QW165_01210 [Candidatus Woesearchaeota archaeon]
MRGWHILLAIVVLSIAASAAMCTDTDGGGGKSKDDAVKTRGEVKYGITAQVDTCLTSEDGVSTNKSKYLKEYFCELDQRKSEVYDCVKLGFSGCENGECKGASSDSASNQKQVVQQVSSCGNERIEKDKGEECDPPNSICFGKTRDQYGQCDSNCKCRIAGAAAAEHKITCGDDVREGAEECEKDDECPDNYVCSSCKCVKQLTPEEIEAMKKQAAGKGEVGIAKEIDEKYKAPEVTPFEVEAKDFTKEPAIKATSGIANFFRKIFVWIGTLFS